MVEKKQFVPHWIISVHLVCVYVEKCDLNQLEPIIPLKANKDVLRKLHANFRWKSMNEQQKQRKPQPSHFESMPMICIQQTAT